MASMMAEHDGHGASSSSPRSDARNMKLYSTSVSLSPKSSDIRTGRVSPFASAHSSNS